MTSNMLRFTLGHRAKIEYPIDNNNYKQHSIFTKRPEILVACINDEQQVKTVYCTVPQRSFPSGHAEVPAIV